MCGISKQVGLPGGRDIRKAKGCSRQRCTLGEQEAGMRS